MIRNILILLLGAIIVVGCRKFDWDNPNDGIIKDKEPTSLKQGLVAYYPFNGNAGDSSGYGRNGQINGAVSATDRNNKANSAYIFTNSNIAVPIGSSLFDSSFSVSLWVLSTGFSTYAQYPTILDGENNYFTIQYGINTVTPNIAGFYLTESRGVVFGGVGSIVDFTRWNHIVIVYQNGFSYFYVNGFLLNKSSDQTLNRKMISGSFIVLGNGIQLPQCEFVGKLDDIRIYNRALAQSEITYLATH